MYIFDDIAKAVGANQAAKKQEKNIHAAMDIATEGWKEQQGFQQPWMQAGQTSLGRMMGLMNDPSSIANDPSFQFRLAEGNKALERSAAARGGLNSGRFAKGMARYSQGLASEEYGNQWNRLAGLAGMGQHSADVLTSGSQNYTNNMGQFYGAMGNAQAAGATGIADGIGGAMRSAGNIATMGLGGGLSSLGIPGLGGGGGGGGGYYGGGIPTQNRINPLGRY